MDPLALAVLALALGLPVVALTGAVARQAGWVDAPAPHKMHLHAVPRIGGFGVAAALGLALVIGSAVRGTLAGEGPLPDGDAFLLPAWGFFFLGLADDRWRLRARTKLIGQVLLAGGAVALGLRWHGWGAWGYPDLVFGAWTPLMTGLWIVAVVTVVNFLDGIDLITACTASVALAAGAAWGHGPGDGALYAAALGALLGFAWWNVTPARVMIGDGGTHMLGFLLATLALEEPGPGAAQGRIPWPVVGALLLPGVVDVGAGLVAKWRRGVPLAAAHKDHPYQRLVRLGLPAPAVALRYGALVLLALWAVVTLEPAWALGLGALVLGLHLADAARAPRAPASFFHGGSGAGRDHGGMLRNFGWVRPGRLAGMGRPESDDWPVLHGHGVRAVLSLTETPPPGRPAEHGLEHRHEPIEDFGTPDEALLQRCVDWVVEQLRQDRPVVVHCFAGVGRTGTILAAVLVAQGSSAQDAIREVRRARPGSLETAGQVGAVQRLAQRLGRA